MPKFTICPECGSQVRIADDSGKFTVCTHCGTQIRFDRNNFQNQSPEIISCPECGKKLTVSDPDRKFMFCRHCGAKIEIAAFIKKPPTQITPEPIDASHTEMVQPAHMWVTLQKVLERKAAPSTIVTIQAGTKK